MKNRTKRNRDWKENKTRSWKKLQDDAG